MISGALYEHILENYNVELNYKQLMWGSIAPDLLPKYKLYRHYYENSIDYIILRIAKLIFVNRFLDFNSCDFSNIRIFSKDIGIISHYLSDFTCLAHSDRWVFPKSLVKHVKYEKELDNISKTHEFNPDIIKADDLEIGDVNLFETLPKIKSYIAKVIEEYRQEKSMERDLDYAMSLNFKIMEYAIESILVYSSQTQVQFA